MYADDMTAEARKPAQNAGLSKQIIASVIVSVATFQAGMFGGWLSPMSLILLEEDSPVEAMTKDELALLSSLPFYADIFLSFMMAFICKTVGRKFPLVLAGVVSSIAGAVITFAPIKIYLHVGRLLGCIIVATVAPAYMYISETVHDSIRGTMLSLSTMLMNAGILTSYVLGSLLSYKAYNAIFIFLPFVYAPVVLFWFPESPHFLVEKLKHEEAKKSLTWLRGGDRFMAEREFDDIVAASKNEEGRILRRLREILTTKSAILAIVISVMGYAFQAVSGVQAILNYAGLIFKEAGSLMSPETCSMITGSILTVACFINLLLIDRLGRKPLLYVSFIGGIISMLTLTIFLYVRMRGANVDGYGWIPIGSVGVFMAVYGMGLSSVAGALANEVTPTSIRPVVNFIVDLLVFPILSGVVQSFPYLDDHLGLYSVFAIPVGCNIVATLFTYFVIPETKGKSFGAIEDELKNW